MSAESDYDGDEHGRRNKSDRKRAPSSPGNKDRGGNNSSSSSLLGLKKTDSQGNEIIEDHENTDGKGSGRANGGSGSGNDDGGGDRPETGRTGSTTGNDHQGDEDGSTSGLDPEEKEKRDREERIAASLKGVRRRWLRTSLVTYMPGIRSGNNIAGLRPFPPSRPF